MILILLWVYIPQWIFTVGAEFTQTYAQHLAHQYNPNRVCNLVHPSASQYEATKKQSIKNMIVIQWRQIQKHNFS